jgi:hypothetical protein
MRRLRFWSLKPPLLLRVRDQPCRPAFDFRLWAGSSPVRLFCPERHPEAEPASVRTSFRLFLALLWRRLNWPEFPQRGSQYGLNGGVRAARLQLSEAACGFFRFS